MSAATSKGLKSSAYHAGITLSSRKTKWLITSNAPRTVDDLTFTSRDDEGRIRWWDVTPAKTDYWHVHQMLGRAYAFELLDLIHNPEAKEIGDHELGCVCEAIAHWMATGVQGAQGMASGFFAVVSEFVSTGTANR